MTHRYVIGGIAFTADRALPDLPDGGFSDLDVDVSFDNDRRAGAQILGPGGTSGGFDRQADRLTLLDHSDPSHNAWLLRQIAPIVSSFSQRLVLHASAVLVGEQVVAFVGETGAGKSTIARALDTGTSRRVADDLVPIRFGEEPRAPAGSKLHPLGAICFLERSPNVLRLTRLAATNALESEIRHGFGEHADPAILAFQFDGYHRLASAVPHYGLVIPDNIDSLESVTAFIEAEFGEGNVP